MLQKISTATPQACKGLSGPEQFAMPTATDHSLGRNPSGQPRSHLEGLIPLRSAASPGTSLGKPDVAHKGSRAPQSRNQMVLGYSGGVVSWAFTATETFQAKADA